MVGMKLIDMLSTVQVGDTVRFRSGGHAIIEGIIPITSIYYHVKFFGHSKSIKFYINGEYYTSGPSIFDIVSVERSSSNEI